MKKSQKTMLILAGVGIAGLALAAKAGLLGGQGGGGGATTEGGGVLGIGQPSGATTESTPGAGTIMALPGDSFGGFPSPGIVNITELLPGGPAPDVTKKCYTCEAGANNIGLDPDQVASPAAVPQGGPIGTLIGNVTGQRGYVLTGSQGEKYSAMFNEKTGILEVFNPTMTGTTMRFGPAGTTYYPGTDRFKTGNILGIGSNEGFQAFVARTEGNVGLPSQTLSSDVTTKKEGTLASGGFAGFASPDVEKFAMAGTTGSISVLGTSPSFTGGSAGGTMIAQESKKASGGTTYSVVSRGQISASGSAGAPSGAVAAVASANMSSAAAFSASIAASKKSGSYYGSAKSSSKR